MVPSAAEDRHDIIQSIELGSPEAMEAFCSGIQGAAPVDSFDDLVIMAAGDFVQGSSIELSADGPMREPYAIYYQGGLTFPHAKLGVMLSLQRMAEKGLLSLN